MCPCMWKSKHTTANATDFLSSSLNTVLFVYSLKRVCSLLIPCYQKSTDSTAFSCTIQLSRICFRARTIANICTSRHSLLLLPLCLELFCEKLGLWNCSLGVCWCYCCCRCWIFSLPFPSKWRRFKKQHSQYPKKPPNVHLIVCARLYHPQPHVSHLKSQMWWRNTHSCLGPLNPYTLHSHSD